MSPRGGARAGRQGVTYSNRSDMNSAPKLPAVAAPGQVYGAGSAQVAAQQAVPMAPQPTPGPPVGQANPPAPVQPGQYGPLTRPTERPGEPVTAGAASGPGPGPEILPSSPNPAVAGYQTGRDAVTALAAQAPTNSALAYLAASFASRA